MKTSSTQYKVLSVDTIPFLTPLAEKIKSSKSKLFLSFKKPKKASEKVIIEPVTEIAKTAPVETAEKPVTKTKIEADKEIAEVKSEGLLEKTDSRKIAPNLSLNFKKKDKAPKKQVEKKKSPEELKQERLYGANHSAAQPSDISIMLDNLADLEVIDPLTPEEELAEKEAITKQKSVDKEAYDKLIRSPYAIQVNVDKPATQEKSARKSSNLSSDRSFSNSRSLGRLTPTTEEHEEAVFIEKPLDVENSTAFLFPTEPAFTHEATPSGLSVKKVNAPILDTKTESEIELVDALMSYDEHMQDIVRTDFNTRKLLNKTSKYTTSPVADEEEMAIIEETDLPEVIDKKVETPPSIDSKTLSTPALSSSPVVKPAVEKKVPTTSKQSPISPNKPVTVPKVEKTTTAKKKNVVLRSGPPPEIEALSTSKKTVKRSTQTITEISNNPVQAVKSNSAAAVPVFDINNPRPASTYNDTPIFDPDQLDIGLSEAYILDEEGKELPISTDPDIIVRGVALPSIAAAVKPLANEPEAVEALEAPSPVDENLLDPSLATPVTKHGKVLERRLITPAEAYDMTLTEVEQQRIILSELYQQDMPYEERAELIEAASRLLEKVVAEDITHHWYGTAFDREGWTATPGTGRIACSYFVVTMLMEAGLEADRIKLSQQSAQTITKTICRPENIVRYTSKDELYEGMEERGKGLYVIGFDHHVGMLYHDGTECFLIHSSPLPPSTVARLPLVDAPSLRFSKNYDVGKVTDNKNLVHSWLTGTKLPIIKAN